MNLATKIILSLFCVLVVFMGGLTYLIGKWQRTQLASSTLHYSTVLGEAIRESIAAEMEAGRSDKVQETLENIGKGSQIRTHLIFDHEGLVLRSGNPAEVGKKILTVDLERNLRHLSTPFERRKNDEPLISFIKPFPNENRCQRCHKPKEKVIGYLELDISIQPMEDLFSFGEKILWGGMGITLLIVAGSILLITSRWIRTPLSRVTRAMMRVESGDLAARVETRSQDELGMVARTFNSMAETLWKAKQDLETMHQRELERSQKMATLGELAAGLAHEIRNPLTGIATAVEVIRDGLKKDDPRKKIFDEIMDQAFRLEKLVSNLLQFAGTSPPQLSLLSLQEIIEMTIDLFSYQIQNQRICVEKEFQPHLPPLHGDPKQIQQALMNIILNSIQAMPHGGHLRFRTFFRSEEGMFQLTITDTGVGIPEDLIPKIFKPFYTSKAKGAGLGLAIVEKVILEHKGKVSISSRIGVGTTLEIFLPASRR
jgi:two-component system NtrC family sensor kinase